MLFKSDQQEKEKEPLRGSHSQSFFSTSWWRGSRMVYLFSTSTAPCLPPQRPLPVVRQPLAEPLWRSPTKKRFHSIYGCIWCPAGSDLCESLWWTSHCDRSSAFSLILACSLSLSLSPSLSLSLSLPLPLVAHRHTRWTAVQSSTHASAASLSCGSPAASKLMRGGRISWPAE